MPEKPVPVLVTVVGPDETWIEPAMYYGNDPCFVGLDGTVYDGERWADRRANDEWGVYRLTAWRPAPQPYREVSK